MKTIHRIFRKKFLIIWPFYIGDGELAIKNLEWIRELRSFYPWEILLSYEHTTPDWMIESVRILAKATFKKVHELSRLSPPKGVYANNVAFRDSVFFAESLGRPYLWLEPDAIPIKPYWLQTLQDAYWNGGKDFAGPIVDERGHMNGTGVYPPDASKRIMTAIQNPDEPWDVLMKSMMIDDCHDLRPFFCHGWGLVDGKLHPHLGESPSFDTLQSLNLINREAVIMHRNKDGSLIDRLREARLIYHFGNNE